jgi:hypothetical protein
VYTRSSSKHEEPKSERNKHKKKKYEPREQLCYVTVQRRVGRKRRVYGRAHGVPISLIVLLLGDFSKMFSGCEVEKQRQET